MKAIKVPLLIEAEGKKGDETKVLERSDPDPNSRDSTNEIGEYKFVINACLCQFITIQVMYIDRLA